MKTATQLSKELKKIRIDFEITRSQMAKELKISDKELANIEAGKSEVTYSFLQSVANRYAEEDCVDHMLESLQLAFLKSASVITFKLSELNDHQRMRVIDLQSQIESENAAINAAAEEERRKQREQRAAERLAKKAAKKEETAEEVPVPRASEEVPEVVDASSEADTSTKEAELSDEDLNVLSALDSEFESLMGELAA